MKTMIIDGIEVELGSGNNFADLNIPAADSLKAMTTVVLDIRRLIIAEGLRKESAAELMNISHTSFSDIMRGEFTGLSLQKLQEGFLRLISITTSREKKTD